MIFYGYSSSFSASGSFFYKSEVLMKLNIYSFLRFSTSKCSYYTLIFHETFLAVNGKKGSWRYFYNKLFVLSFSLFEFPNLKIFLIWSHFFYHVFYSCKICASKVFNLLGSLWRYCNNEIIRKPIITSI